MQNIGLFLQAAPAAGEGGGGIFSIVMMVGIFVIFYLVLILPESRRRNKLKKQIEAIKAGDKIVTTGGIIGTVDYISERTLYIKSIDAKFEIAKDFVAQVLTEEIKK